MLLCHFDIKRRRAICVIRRAILTQSKSESFYSYGQNLKNLSYLWENWNKQEQSQACLDYAERRQFLERSEKIIFPCFPCILCGINLYRIHVNLCFINDNLR
jgi:hypothetical protein